MKWRRSHRALHRRPCTSRSRRRRTWRTESSRAGRSVRFRTYVRGMRDAANSSSLRVDSEAQVDFAWLAGVLEAEGTFLRPPPSGPNSPIVTCRMTDRDVVERVAAMIGSTVGVVHRPPYKTQFRTTLKGVRAVNLMVDLKPLMSSRRTAAIEVAVARFKPSNRKLDYPAAEEIRDLHAEGALISCLARSFDVARSTIREVIAESIYAAPPSMPWRSGASHAHSTGRPPRRDDISAAELYWLAGWLEGEGSFVRPPPSDPKRPRIVGVTRDLDVAREVARLLGVTPSRSYTDRARERGWSPTWQLLCRGRRAVALMEALHPLMGARRQAQICEALSWGRIEYSI